MWYKYVRSIHGRGRTGLVGRWYCDSLFMSRSEGRNWSEKF
ncbi:hypothetical protein [Rubritalea tangerina]